MIPILLSLLCALGAIAAPAIVATAQLDVSRLNSPKVAVDSAGNIFVGGGVTACTLPTLKPISTCGPAWVAKFDPTGKTMYFATYLGTSATTSAQFKDLQLDVGGNVLALLAVAGGSMPTVNAAQPRYGGGGDAYLCKLAADGSQLLYATYLGGSAIDQPAGLYLDNQSAAYVWLSLVSPDFPATPGAVNEPRSSQSNAIVKLSPDGRTIVYAASVKTSFSQSATVRPDGVVRLIGTSEVITFASDGSSVTRNVPPSLPVTALNRELLFPADGGTWITGSITGATLTLTADAEQPNSGLVPYLRIEDGQAIRPESLSTAHVTSGLAADPADRRRLYAATDGGIYRSEDNGWTWSAIAGFTASTITVDPLDSDTLYATGPCNPVISRDRGVTWSTKVLSACSAATLVPDPATPNRLYAAGRSLWSSDDGGETFQESEYPKPIPFGGSGALFITPQLLAADPTQPGRAYVLATTQCTGFCPVSPSLLATGNGGASYTTLKTGPDLSARTNFLPSALAVHPYTGDVYLAFSGRVRVYRNGNFEQPDVLFPDGVTSLALDPQQVNTVYVALADLSLRRSDDGGRTWRVVTSTPKPAQALVVGDGGVLLANGHLVVAGSTGPGLPVRGALQPDFGGGLTDGFFAEFDERGKLVTSTYLGGEGKEGFFQVLPLADGTVALIGEPAISVVRIRP